VTSILENLSALWDAIPNPFEKGDHDLIVLRVVLELREGGAQAVLDLTAYGKVSDAGKRTWRLTFQDLGLADATRPASTPQINLPLQVQEGLRASVALMNPGSDLPLWLNLVRPYGHLGLLPWEDVLGKLLNRPVLRLPDFLERPRENTDVLEYGIVFDPPPETSSDKATDQLKSIVEQILAASSRATTRINVFTTDAWSERLGKISSDNRVQLHPPKNASALVEALRAKTDKSPETQSEYRMGRRFWLDWICAAVEGRSLDAVHFVGRAQSTATRRGLLISSTPLPEDGLVTLSLVEIADIGTTLTRVGAWAAIFSPPPDESGASTMAYVADAFAHSRPGTVLYHRARPEDRENLRQGFKFMFSSGASRPPKIVNGFIYCQPAAVVAHADFQGKFVLDSLTRNTELVGKPASFAERARAKAAAYIPIIRAHDPQQAPNWASAVQRYIESATLDQLRLNSTDVLFTKPDAPGGQVVTAGQNEVLKETLSDIQKVIGNYLRKADQA
jgi:hypothetical protein